MARTPRPVLDRFAAKIALVDSGCIEWIGAKTVTGYGSIHAGPNAPLSRFMVPTVSTATSSRGENTRLRNGRGGRECRVCCRERDRNRRTSARKAS